jgi:D-glycero-D-manno-heptose 1,7-bisphosphate phosphatase
VTVAAVLLDRDGVLNELVRDPVSGAPESPLRAQDVRLTRGVGALGELARAGAVLACVSNQPAAAKGKVSVEQLYEVHARVLELLAREGVHIAAWRLCLHHPEGTVGELSRACTCRKPAPGMLLEVAAQLELDLADAWMVGDTDGDVAAGKAAGCHTVLISYPGSAHKRAGHASPELCVRNLRGAVERLLAFTSTNESETVDETMAVCRASKRAANQPHSVER